MGYILKRFKPGTAEVEYEVGVESQDGTDRCTEQTEAEAVATYRLNTKWSYGFPPENDPDPKGLSVPVPPITDKTTWPEVLITQNGKIEWQRAAAHAVEHCVCRPGAQPLREGERYRMIVTLEKVEDVFIGTGI